MRVTSLAFAHDSGNRTADYCSRLTAVCLGHASVAVTERSYAFLKVDRLPRAIDPSKLKNFGEQTGVQEGQRELTKLYKPLIDNE